MSYTIAIHHVVIVGGNTENQLNADLTTFNGNNSSTNRNRNHGSHLKSSSVLARFNRRNVTGYMGHSIRLSAYLNMKLINSLVGLSEKLELRI